MKWKCKTCLILLLFLLFVVSTKTNAYVKTGHDEFMEINFCDNDAKLLVNRSSDEIEKAYQLLKGGKIFGWKTYYLNVNSKANYIGETLFSRSNRTSNPFTINYKVDEETYQSKSIRINGSVSGKITLGNSKSKVEGSISPSFSAYYDKTNTHSKEETTDFKLTILPNTKITLRVSGEAYVTSGVSKYYFLGICLRKGEWERVDVETMYYELVEEVYE